LEGVDEIKTALGWQSGSSVGLARWSHPDGQPFLCTTSARLAVDHPGLKIEFVRVSDRLGDMIEDRLELALRLGEITNSCRSHA
jgi:DNA-binding transcriptional LysR family regulator